MCITIAQKHSRVVMVCGVLLMKRYNFEERYNYSLTHTEGVKTREKVVSSGASSLSFCSFLLLSLGFGFLRVLFPRQLADTKKLRLLFHLVKSHHPRVTFSLSLSLS